MFGAFSEAVRATTQACTLLLLAPVLAVVIATRCRWQSLVAAVVAAVVGGWVFAANSLVLDGFQLRVSAVIVLAALVLILIGPRHQRLGWATDVRVQTLAVGVVTFLAALWWRPCVGTELGVILTGAHKGLAGELPGMTAYMIGAMAPVALVVLLARTVAPQERALTAASWVGATLGIVIAGALVIGRHDEVVVTLNRLTAG
jgi:hypothetical protein